MRGPLRRVSASQGSTLPYQPAGLWISPLASVSTGANWQAASVEVRSCLKKVGWSARLRRGWRVRVDDADTEAEFSLHDLDRQLQIGVVRDHDRDVAVAREGVDEQEGGEVDVRALLLRLHHLDRARTAGTRTRQRHPRHVAQVMAVVDREPRDRLQRTQVDLLPLGASGLSGRALTVAVK